MNIAYTGYSLARFPVDSLLHQKTTLICILAADRVTSYRPSSFGDIMRETLFEILLAKILDFSIIVLIP